jgi:hypothetical protein
MPSQFQHTQRKGGDIKEHHGRVLTSGMRQCRRGHDTHEEGSLEGSMHEGMTVGLATGMGSMCEGTVGRVRAG